MIEGLFKILALLGMMLLLSGCPREGRYVVHNATPSSIHVATSEGPVAIRSRAVATIMQYDKSFEISKDGRAQFKFSTPGGSVCRTLDLSSYRFDQDAYFGLGQYSTVTLVVLPTRQVFVVPYTVDPMTEVRSGAILERPRLPECPASSKSKKLRKPDVAPSAMVNFSEFIEIADRYAVEELQLKQGEYACKLGSLDDQHVKVSIQTQAFQGQPGGGGEIVLAIDRTTRQVVEVLHAQ